MAGDRRSARRCSRRGGAAEGEVRRAVASWRRPPAAARIWARSGSIWAYRAAMRAAGGGSMLLGRCMVEVRRVRGVWRQTGSTVSCGGSGLGPLGPDLGL